MQFRHAIVRIPGSTFASGLTTGMHGAPDYALALQQHARYCAALEQCGLALTVLEPDLRHPDSTFVEDTAVLVAESAVLTRPGASTRVGEVEAIRDTIENAFHRVEAIVPPGTLDGGDICEAGDHFFIGISERTNEAGANQLAEILNRLGCTSAAVDIRGIQGLLHLKSGLAYIGDRTIVITETLVGCEALRGYRQVLVDPEEEYAANCIRVNDHILMAAGHPKLKAALEARKYRLIELEMSEFQKMDGGLSCLSLRF